MLEVRVEGRLEADDPRQGGGALSQMTVGTDAACARAQGFITEEVVQQAKEVRDNQWDWHPTASLPSDLMLAAFADGVWICEACCNLNRATRLVRVGDSWS